MKITLHPDGQLIVRDGARIAYSADQAVVDADCPATFPPPPAGFVSATFDSATGLTVGYDAFGNATPGIDWPAARRVATATEVLVKAQTDRRMAVAAVEKAAIEREAARKLPVGTPKGAPNGRL